jgi:hypothetical protein
MRAVRIASQPLRDLATLPTSVRIVGKPLKALLKF